MEYHLKRWLYVTLWMILILALSVGPPGPKVNELLPYFVHFLEYAVLGVLIVRAIAYTWGMAFYSSALFATAVATTYGIGMEFVQSFLPYRSFSVSDMVVNFAGAILGVAT